MKKEIIKEKIFQKHYDGLITGFKFSDLPKDLLPDDIIDLEKNEGYYSENNSPYGLVFHTNTSLIQICSEDISFPPLRLLSFLYVAK